MDERIDTLEGWKRTLYCGELRAGHIGTDVVLMGWIQRRRDHGGLIFVDLRDRDGITQVVFNPAEASEAHARAHGLRSEYVIAVKGVVSKRPLETENPELKTGEVEVMAAELKILNDSAPLPFMIEDETDVAESLRFKYRYLDLRRPSLQKNLILRHRVAASVRDYLNRAGFLDIETPVLTRSTPEGARDFLVPSRLNAGHFYALPQSPQLFKQILMVAGFDRYFQIVRCFRDEDLRADRQPEFTQVDVEMSFVEMDDVMEVMEGLIAKVFEEVKGVEVTLPFPRLRYDDALNRFGRDRPDTRYGMELVDLTEVVRGCGFKVFDGAVQKGGLVKAINVKNGASFSRKEIDDLTVLAVSLGARGLAWVKVNEDGWQSPIAKFLQTDTKEAIARAVGAGAGDLLLFCADAAAVVHSTLGALRVELAARLGLIPPDTFNFVWVMDFPLLEYVDHEKRHTAVHHPFTAPMDRDIAKLDTAPGEVRSKAYDLVLNGVEIGGGSIRIHRPEMQERILSLLGMDTEEARSRFGFLLDALSYGAPPHGGIAFGLDRIVATMVGSESIRDVIAFPKTQKAACLMSEAPSPVDKTQLRDLSIKVIKPE